MLPLHGIVIVPTGFEKKDMDASFLKKLLLERVDRLTFQKKFKILSFRSTTKC